MRFADLLIAMIPAMATLAFAGGVLRAARTMAPPAWPYWMAVVFAVSCLGLPIRYGPGFIPDEALLGTPRALVFDLLLQGSFSAVAVGLGLRARSLALGGKRAANGVLILASLACLAMLALELWLIID
jgi:hypothetical protein